MPIPAAPAARCQRPHVPVCGIINSTKTCPEPHDHGARPVRGTGIRTLLPTLSDESDSSSALQHPDLRSAHATACTALCKCTRCARSGLGFITTPVNCWLDSRARFEARVSPKCTHICIDLCLAFLVVSASTTRRSCSNCAGILRRHPLRRAGSRACRPLLSPAP